MSRHIPVACLFAVSMIIGCSNDGKGDVSNKRIESMTGQSMKKVVPVSGTVTLDGNPAPNVYLYLHSSDGGKDILQECKTDEKGAYCWNTYLKCDGLAPGDYKLSFKQLARAERKAGSEKDQLNGRYSNPKKGDFTLTVKADTPMKDVNYELTSK